MKDTKDLFSYQSGDYRKFRPDYPPEFLEEIISHSGHRRHAWDCGTGNGQVAVSLGKYFEYVKATDISTSQLDNALQANNVSYQTSRAEQTEFEPGSFDLITVAQAVHWFDFDAFYSEVKRVGHPDGILALWGYGLLRIEPAIDRLIDNFYYKIIGSFWDKERKYIEDAYRSIPFPFSEIHLSTDYFIEKEFTRESLAGYLGTWSAVRNFKKSTGSDPIPGFLKELTSKWASTQETKKAVFPLFSRVGKIHDPS